LLAVAPYIDVEYHADTFIEELDRLLEQDAEKVSLILGRALVSYQPDFDYEDRLKNLLKKLAQSGHRDDALYHLDSVRRLPGIDQLFKQLTEGMK
jgi:hypothetical protein